MVSVSSLADELEALCLDIHHSLIQKPKNALTRRVQFKDEVVVKRFDQETRICDLKNPDLAEKNLQLLIQLTESQLYESQMQDRLIQFEESNEHLRQQLAQCQAALHQARLEREQIVQAYESYIAALIQ
jgi:hypothetical protein